MGGVPVHGSGVGQLELGYVKGPFQLKPFYDFGVFLLFTKANLMLCKQRTKVEMLV